MGFLWEINDVIYGNEERDRKPVTAFIEEVNKYPGLLDIIVYICGLVNKRGVHASGVILYGDNPFETASFMRSPGWDLVTCWDLHEAEAAGDTKYDFLVTEASDKIIKCYEMLKEDKQIEDEHKLEQLMLVETNNFLKTVKSIDRKNQMYVDGYSIRDNTTNNKIKEFNKLLGTKTFYNKRKS